ncbi:MAG: hypothetical protein Q8S33_23360 [Myxococcales bacterium]|nr:hypothetical protein [Myxococcales bacterium]
MATYAVSFEACALEITSPPQARHTRIADVDAMEPALPWLKLVVILVGGIVGSVLTIRFAVAAIWWAKKSGAAGASFMLSSYRALGNGQWWSESETNAPPGSTSAGTIDGAHHDWSDTSHHPSCGNSGSGDGASSC